MKSFTCIRNPKQWPKPSATVSCAESTDLLILVATPRKFFVIFRNRWFALRRSGNDRSAQVYPSYDAGTLGHCFLQSGFLSTGGGTKRRRLEYGDSHLVQFFPISP